MKSRSYLLLLLFILLSSNLNFAQQKSFIEIEQLPTIELLNDNSIHFVSPQPIKYVDISTSLVKGDIPVDNILRIKLHQDSTNNLVIPSELGTLTIVAEDFIAQYRLRYSELFSQQAPALIEISNQQQRTFPIQQDNLSRNNMQNIALHMLSQRNPKPIARNKDYGITLELNQIYAVADYIFLDISIRNDTKLSYDVDEFRFFIEDKKIIKASNFQSIELNPVWKFRDLPKIKNKQRNIYVIKKAIFPGGKIMRLSLTEKQISGRMLDLFVEYKDILGAQSF